MTEHYLYRHIRVDKNIPFYIGVGTVVSTIQNSRSRYARAFATYDRNSFWCSIINKTDYEIEIMLESNNYNYILEREKEFIELYGRRDLGKGVLVNLTDGGEGCLGIEINQETRDKMSAAHKNRHFTKEWRNKISKSKTGKNNAMYGVKGKDNKRSIPVIQYDLNDNYLNEYISLTIAAEKTDSRMKNIS